MKGLFTENLTGGEAVEDREIVALYWKRDETAIAETTARYGNYCYSIAYNILHNKEDAGECVNDTYMHAWNSMPPHRPENLATFLGKLTRCICLKKWRDLRAQKRGNGEILLAYEELSACIPAKGDIDSELETKEIAAVIDDFLRTLPSVQRKIFICRYWYFDSIKAISGQSGFSESKVKSILFRTRAKLRLRLKKEGIYVEK